MITAVGLEVFGTDFARLDPQQRLDAVKQLLGRYRGLLVWDNFESVREMPDPAGATPPLDEADCAQLPEFLQWVRDRSRSAVIITSRAREDWLGQVRRMEVSGLNAVEAAAYASFLLEPYPAARRRRERRSFGELLQWLDGHPLAMRLTLPRLDTTEPADLLSQLHGTTPLPAQDTEAARLSSLGACVTHSFSHLTGQTRRLLPAVTLFHGIADGNLLTTFSAVQGVPDRFAGVSRQEWTAVLEDAARVGLLTGLGRDMYQIHPALPGYLATGWYAGDPAGYIPEREACEQALCTACAAFSRWATEQIESGDAALAYAVIGLLRRTLGAMLGLALDRRARADADGIVRALNPYWETRGLTEEAATWIDRILAATADLRQAPPESAQSLWLYATMDQANRQRDAGKLDQAGRTYQHALAYLQDQPETEWTRRNISVTYHRLGGTAYFRGRLDEADDWYRKALTIFEDLGDRPHMAGTYHQLGNTAYFRGRLDEADDWYRKALTIFGDLGNRPDTASIYHLLSITAQNRGRLDEASDWCRKALTIFEDLGDRPHMAGTYHELGVTAYLGGRLDEADDWYRKALTIFGDLGDRPNMAGTYHQLGMAARQRGRLNVADDWYRRAIAIFKEFGDRRGMALSYAELGLLDEERAQPRRAIEWIIRCVTLFDQFPSPQTGTGPVALARLTRQLGRPALEQTWQQITGQPVPQAVRDYITSHHDKDQPGGEP